MCSDPAPTTDTQRHDPTRIHERLREDAAEVRSAALEEAVAKLEAESGLTDERHEVVTDLATAIARGTIAPAAAALDGEADPETIRAVARLYDLDTGE